MLFFGWLWQWAADHCEEGCDRWSYNDVLVFVVTYGPPLFLVDCRGWVRASTPWPRSVEGCGRGI
jgi:hypothetical protein